jgi:hypothetical protein
MATDKKAPSAEERVYLAMVAAAAQANHATLLELLSNLSQATPFADLSPAVRWVCVLVAEDLAS